jgi:hypothetical protein
MKAVPRQALEQVTFPNSLSTHENRKCSYRLEQFFEMFWRRPLITV